MKLSIIIPNYNGEELLIKNLPKVISALKSCSESFEIVISDDGSTDKSVDVIKEFQKNQKDIDIKLIEAKENKGFSTNVNRAVKEAKGEFLVLLNTDVLPKENFIKKILPHFDDEKVFAVGMMDESVEGDSVIKRGRGKGEWRRGLLVHGAAFIESGDTLWVAGGSGVFRKKIWDDLGGLDEIYNPFYWEDIDVSYRARKAGFKTLFEKESIVRHEHEKGSIKRKFSEDKIKKIAYRNQFVFAWKNSDFGTLIVGLFWLPYHLLRGAASRDSAMLAGFFEALGKLSKILSSRRNSKDLFSLSDKQVTSGAR